MRGKHTRCSLLGYRDTIEVVLSIEKMGCTYLVFMHSMLLVVTDNGGCMIADGVNTLWLLWLLVVRGSR